MILVSLWNINQFLPQLMRITFCRAMKNSSGSSMVTVALISSRATLAFGLNLPMSNYPPKSTGDQKDLLPLSKTRYLKLNFISERPTSDLLILIMRVTNIWIHIYWVLIVIMTLNQSFLNAGILKYSFWTLE